MPVSPSVSSSVHTEQVGSHWTDLREILYLGIFWKSVEIIQVSLKYNRNNDTLHEDQYTFFNHLAQFFLEWEMFLTKFLEKITTHILFEVILTVHRR